jgi:hypothetical protein
MALVEILHQYNPPDNTGLSTARVAEIAETHLLDVVSKLPITPHLPKSTELGVLHEGDPTIVEKSVTAQDLISHLEGATKATPEISIDVFSDGTNVVRVGTTESVLPNLGWTPFADRAVVDFHTHPDPTEAPPSLRDLDLPRRGSSRAVMIGSTDGITFVPRFSDEPSAHVWRRYVTETRGLDEADYEEYGASRIYEEFLADVVRPVFVSWAYIEPSKTLVEIAEILVAQ